MGINTVILLHNDSLSDIEKNAEDFIQELALSIRNMHRLDKAHIGAGQSANAAQIVSSAHSSMDHFIRVYGNRAQHVSWADTRDEDLDAMADFLRSKGYTVESPKE